MALMPKNPCQYWWSFQAADKIGTFVSDKGEPKKLLQKLLAPDHDFAQDAQCKAALLELQVWNGKPSPRKQMHCFISIETFE